MKHERMSGKERTLTAIRHEEPDRVPLNIWNFRTDVQAQVIARYGSLEAFNAAHHIDVFMAITPPPNRHNPDFLEQKMTCRLEDVTDADFVDPDDPANYAGVKELVLKYGDDKCVLCHVWGVLESLYSFIGVEETLYQFALWEPPFQALARKVARWSARVAENAVTLGIDVLHVSGDVGANQCMIVNPDAWRERVCPLERPIYAVGRKAGLPCSLHSCGFFLPVMDDLLDMGVRIAHPCQQSAGMDLKEIKARWGARVTIHGGLDIRYYLPRAPEAELIEHIRANLATCKPGGGFIFNTEHTVQPDTTVDRLELAYRTALEHSWY